MSIESNLEEGVNDNGKDTMKDIFGENSDSEASDNEVAPVVSKEVSSKKSEIENIFGEDSDSDSDYEGSSSVNTKDNVAPKAREVTDENIMDFMYEEGDEIKTSQSKLKATHAKICIPNSHKLSAEASTFTLKLPNFLKIQTNPYNKQTHHEDAEASLFAGATSMVRWSYKYDHNGEVELDEKGAPVRESNARLVKWSDGSYQLLVGQEVFESSTFAMADRYCCAYVDDSLIVLCLTSVLYLFICMCCSYLYTQRKSAPPAASDPASAAVTEQEQQEIKTDTCLECVGTSMERIVLRPSSVVSASHARLSLAIAEKYSRKTKYVDRTAILSAIYLYLTFI
jgi:hypothetical protein